MKQLRHILARNNPLASSKTRKLLVELFVAFCAILLIGILVNTVSPYRHTAETAFYNSKKTNDTTYHRATTQSSNESDNSQIRIVIDDGPDTKKILTIPSPIYTKIPVNSHIIVSKNSESSDYNFVDYYRLPYVAVGLTIFIAAVLIIGRRRGAASLVGLIVSIGVIGVMIIPLILAGHDALWVCIAGAFLIAVTSILIAHGFKKRTYISLVCILLLLTLVAIAATLSVSILHLTGLADEAAGMLSTNIDLSGLLIGGIIIATLGVLDDIVTAQVAIVDELMGANSKLSLQQVYKKAMSVGSEHIAALVNTLALIYAGTALPLILLISSHSNNIIVLFNSEYIVTEIIRTIISSLALVLAVPMSTFVASLWLMPKNK